MNHRRHLPLSQTRAADHATSHECTAVLDDAAAAGITVLRAWAFADGEQWGALQVRTSSGPTRWRALQLLGGGPSNCRHLAKGMCTQ